jgi:GNAT superfamily N-acetyltransferase
MTQEDSPFEILRLPESEFETLIDFYRAALGDAGARIAELTPWRMAGSPASGGFTPYVVRNQDRAVLGGVAAMGCTLSFAGGLLDASWQGNSVVDRSLRGQGLGGRLVDAAAAEAPAVMAKSTSPAMYGLRKKLGFKDVPNRYYLKATLRIPRPTSAADLGLRTAAFLVGRAKRAARLLGPTAFVPVGRVDHFDDSFDALNRRRIAEPVLRVSKSAAYLNWRYCACPGRDHVILRAGERDARGAIVLRLAHGAGWILDLVAESGDTPAVDALVAAAMRWFSESRARSVTAFCTLPETRSRILRAGFLTTRSTPQFTYRGDLPDPESTPWDFWHGDSDSDLYG